MSVHKYKSIEDVPPPPRPKTALDGFRIACELSTLTAEMGRRRPTPGVDRYRSIEEAKAHKN